MLDSDQEPTTSNTAMDFPIPWTAGNFFHTQLPKVFSPWVYVRGIVSVARI